MKLYQLISATIHPFDMICIFDESSHTLYSLNDFIIECYKNHIEYTKLTESLVTNICVNGDCIQCEVIFDE